MLLDLAPALNAQEGLFDRADDARSRARMKALDALNGRYGRDTVTFAATGRKRGWKLRREMLSPRYTNNHR
jgi:DNA polymerase V